MLRCVLRCVAEALADLVLPPRCNFCGQALVRPARQPLLCDACRCELLDFDGPVCPRCAAPVSAVHTGGDCPRCQGRRYRFRKAAALGLYGGALREAVIRMKHSAGEPLAIAMGYLLAERLRPAILSAEPDLLVPVPCHWTKRVARGFNPPDLLVEALARRMRVLAAPHLLRWRRRARKQGTLLPSERFSNVRNAFAVTLGYDIRDARIVLVDDIMTTGATADEAAKTLRRAGAAVIDVVVVARGAGLDQRSL